jgi:DnaA N-terminal domain
MVRHGGNNHCNSYQPCWEFFRAAEERWKEQRREHADRFARPSLSPSGRQTCRTGDDDNVTQTCFNNIIPLTSSRQLSANAQPESPGAPGVNPADGLGIFGERIEERLGKEVFGAWFQNVHFVEEIRGRIILSAVTRLAKSYIEQQFEPKVLQCFHPEFPDAVRIEVILRRPLT